MEKNRNLNKVKQIVIKGEIFYYSLSFDIGKYDGGLWWLQIYDDKKQLIYDQPFAIAFEEIDKKKIKKTIMSEFLIWYGGL